MSDTTPKKFSFSLPKIGVAKVASSPVSPITPENIKPRNSAPSFSFARVPQKSPVKPVEDIVPTKISQPVISPEKPVETILSTPVTKTASPSRFSSAGFGPAKREVLKLLESDQIANVKPKRKFKKINTTQVQYEPASYLPPTGAVIPEIMAEETAQALEELAEKVGSIDEWIRGKLKWSQAELAERLTAEQIDAVALAVYAADRKEGLIIADATGFGKGRVVAAVATIMALEDKNVIFITEKANLFSDFWRDVRDIGSQDVFGRPFILNAKIQIIDTTSSDGKVLIPAWKKADVDRILKTNKMPSESKIMLASYSQFNRKGTAKSQFIKEVAENAHMVLDEAHNFVGAKSNTSQTLQEAILLTSSTTYSSATFARDVNNLMAYSSVFPWLSKIENLDDFTPAQKRALTEESVRIATRAGRIIRREHDLSNMTLRMVVDEERLDRNKFYADNLAPILSQMAKLSRMVNAVIMERNESNVQQLEGLGTAEERKSAREFWFAANFGSRLNAIVGQFLVALKVDKCVQEAVQALMEGKKPVIVIDATMESLMRELSREVTESSGDEDEEENDLFIEEEDEEETLVAKPPTFADALRIMSDRLLKVGVRRGKTMEKEEVMLDMPKFVQIRDEIKALASEFPELSLSPIDDIRDRIEASGLKLFQEGKIEKLWKMNEISARSMRVVDGGYVGIPKVERNQIVAQYNNGLISGLVLTRAASTGLSIHDGPKFLEHAPRHMIELRAPPNVIERMQMWGRIFRRGQLTEPTFSTVSTGLEFEEFYLAMQNRKIEELCASVTGTGKNSLAFDIPDLYNALGNEVAYDMLMENQKLSEAMGITLTVEKEEADKELYFIGKLLRRLCLLSSDDARIVFSNLRTVYQDRIRTGAGIHHSGRTLEGVWTVEACHTLEAGDGSDDPIFGRDVNVTTISSTRLSKPYRAIDIQNMVDSVKNNQPFPWMALSTEIQKQKMSTLLELVPTKKYKTVEQALGASDDNSVKIRKRKIENLAFVLTRLAPGVPAKLPGEDGEIFDAIVLDLHVPDEDKLTSPRDYELIYAIPGDERPRAVSLDVVIKGGQVMIDVPERASVILPKFNEVPSGEIKMERRILDGNGLGAVLTARRLGSGTRVAYTDEQGETKTGILLPRSLEKRLANVASVTNIPEVAYDVFEAGGRIRTNGLVASEGAELRQADDKNKVILTIPGGKKAAAVWETASISALTGSFKELYNTREAVLSKNNLMALLRIFKHAGNEFHFDGTYRPLAVAKSREFRKQSQDIENERRPRV